VSKVVAYNGANLIASVAGTDHRRGPVPGTRPTGTADSCSLVGVNDYADARFKLAHAVADAKTLASALGEAGKGLYADEPDVTLLVRRRCHARQA